MINEIKNLKVKIKDLLIKFPHLRDSDPKLIANIWHSQLGAGKAKEITGFDFLSSFSENKFISPETIRRSRQLVQEQNIELRGKSYKKRKAYASTVKKEIQHQ